MMRTTLEETFSFPLRDAIAFTGSADPWVKDCSIADLCQQREIPCHVIQNANHSLETGDVDHDIDNLKIIMKKTGKRTASTRLPDITTGRIMKTSARKPSKC